MSDYQGWSNYETWAANLWLTNTEADYDWLQGTIDDARLFAEDEDEDEVAMVSDIADALRAEFEEAIPDLTASVWSDLLRHAFDMIDWREIARAHLDD